MNRKPINQTINNKLVPNITPPWYVRISLGNRTELRGLAL
jgi:hypothetical protein